MTHYLGSNTKESRAIYWLSFIRRGMELPKDIDLQSFEAAKKTARKLHKRGYHGEVFKVLQTKEYLGWATDGMNVKGLWTF